MGPPSDWALSQLFINGKEGSIYKKIYIKNMDGLQSFFPIEAGLETMASSDRKLAFIEADPISHFSQLNCRVNI